MRFKAQAAFWPFERCVGKRQWDGQGRGWDRECKKRKKKKSRIFVKFKGDVPNSSLIDVTLTVIFCSSFFILFFCLLVFTQLVSISCWAFYLFSLKEACVRLMMVGCLKNILLIMGIEGED